MPISRYNWVAAGLCIFFVCSCSDTNETESARDRAKLGAKLNGKQAARQPAHNGESATIDLPGDPSTAVITMDYVGGFRNDTLPTVTIGGPPDGRPEIEAHIAPKPFLVVQADGTVISTGRVLKKLSIAELKELLRFVVVENAFFDFDEASNAAIAAKEERIRRQHENPDDTQPVEVVVLAAEVLPVDMATTVITVELLGKTHTTECYGNSMLASHDYFKEIQPIQQMDRIERRLRLLTK
ncbi:MAG: hypothetical protein OER86_10175 [Phycisphaerae bacterium]|nr:hypothetical protein [Phycisphaerae bacterium]